MSGARIYKSEVYFEACEVMGSGISFMWSGSVLSERHICETYSRVTPVL
jgi:hypothetical protein